VTLPPHAVEAQRLAEQLRGSGDMPIPLFPDPSRIKRCCRCRRDKKAFDFGRDASKKDGLTYVCRECRSRPRRDNAGATRSDLANCHDLEEWRPVTFDAAAFADRYEVSSCGRVRSTTRVITANFPNGPVHRLLHGALLAALSGADGHLDVQLWRDNQPSRRQIHILVLESFVGPRPASLVGCHGDGDAGNNHVSNLRWDTMSANHLDAVAHGTNWNTAKRLCPRRHLYAGRNLIIRNKRGHRSCYACTRAGGQAGYRGLTGSDREQFINVVSDRIYREIGLFDMEGELEQCEGEGA
jgi:hypothetical protein